MADILSDISQDPDITLHILGNYIGSAYSPQVEVTDTDTGHSVTITYDDAEQGIITKTFDVLDGETGPKGDDGYSPTVAIADNADGHVVTITDATGEHSYTVPTYASEEAARQSAEDARSRAEGARVQAESQRAENESQRAEEWATVKADAEAATTSASSAATNATNAASSARDAAGQATTAAGTATNAAASANTAADAATTAATEASDAAQVATQAAEGITDAYLPRVTVGASDGILGGGPLDESAWLSRACPGTDGPARIESIHGRTLAWNQLAPVPFRGQVTAEGITYTPNSDGSVSLSGTATQTAYERFGTAQTVVGHKYVVYMGGTINSSPDLYIYNDGGGINTGTSNKILATATAAKNVFVRIANGATVDGTLRPQLFDLTQMFGAGNEPSTVAEFEAMFTEPYYPYDAGTLLPVRMTGVESVGFNQWDEQWESGGINGSGQNYANATQVRSKSYIPVISGLSYYLKSSVGLWLWCYDGDKNYLYRLSWSGIGITTSVQNKAVTIPSGVKYIRFAYSGTTYNNDICINLSDPTRNGEYEPHSRSVRSIDVATYFPDGMRSAGSVYDELTATERITRVGAVDLGTLTWEYVNSGGTFFKAALNDAAFAKSSSTIPNDTCALYTTDTPDRVYSGAADKSIAQNINKNLMIHDTAYTDAAAFKAAMSGVMLHYELATTTTQAIDQPLNLTYKAAQGGTERIMHDEPTAPPTLEVAYGYTAASLLDAAASMLADPDGPTATANHAVGSYLTMGGTLYRVTTAIATGEAITPGTNVTATTVMAEVLSLIQ